MRPVLVFAAIILATLFVSAQMRVQPLHEGEHGWAGPQPHQLVSYNVKVGTTRNKWGPRLSCSRPALRTDLSSPA